MGVSSEAGAAAEQRNHTTEYSAGYVDVDDLNELDVMLGEHIGRDRGLFIDVVPVVEGPESMKLIKVYGDEQSGPKFRVEFAGLDFEDELDVPPSFRLNPKNEDDVDQIYDHAILEGINVEQGGDVRPVGDVLQDLRKKQYTDTLYDAAWKAQREIEGSLRARDAAEERRRTVRNDALRLNLNEIDPTKPGTTAAMHELARQWGIEEQVFDAFESDGGIEAARKLLLSHTRTSEAERLEAARAGKLELLKKEDPLRAFNRIAKELGVVAKRFDNGGAGVLINNAGDVEFINPHSSRPGFIAETEAGERQKRELPRSFMFDLGNPRQLDAMLERAEDVGIKLTNLDGTDRDPYEIQEALRKVNVINILTRVAREYDEAAQQRQAERETAVFPAPLAHPTPAATLPPPRHVVAPWGPPGSGTAGGTEDSSFLKRAWTRLRIGEGLNWYVNGEHRVLKSIPILGAMAVAATVVVTRRAGIDIDIPGGGGGGGPAAEGSDTFTPSDLGDSLIDDPAASEVETFEGDSPSKVVDGAEDKINNEDGLGEKTDTDETATDEDGLGEQEDDLSSEGSDETDLVDEEDIEIESEEDEVELVEDAEDETAEAEIEEDDSLAEEESEDEETLLTNDQQPELEEDEIPEIFDGVLENQGDTIWADYRDYALEQQLEAEQAEEFANKAASWIEDNNKDFNGGSNGSGFRFMLEDKDYSGQVKLPNQSILDGFMEEVQKTASEGTSA